ncbi:MAG TPA: oligosaccharide flippase family protein [Fredinandcohnia sp.]|nr:oligosaccharide flippase family protein [Fredinandcohnia sp.]
MRTETTARTAQAAPLSFRKNVSWSFFGTMAHAGAKWLNLVVLARLGGAETVGTLALATAIVAPIFALTNLQLRQIQATDARGRISFSTVLGLRLLTSGLAALGVAVWAGFAARDLGPVVFFVALAHAFESLSDVAHGRLQRAERLDRVARAQAAHGLIGLGLLAGSYALTGSLVWAAAGLALAGLAVFALVDLPSLRQIGGLARPALPRDELTVLLRSALPLGGTMMLVSLLGQFPRYFLEGAAGRGELGVFAALYQLVAAGNLVITAVAQAASPRLANAAHAGDLRAFRRLAGRLYAVIAAISLGGILLSLVAGEIILLHLFGPEFAGRVDALVLLAVAGSVGFASTVPGYGLTAAGAHGVQLPLFAGIAAVSFALCALLVPTHGIRGAAFAMMGTHLVQWLASEAILRARLRRLGAAATGRTP